MPLLPATGVHIVIDGKLIGKIMGHWVDDRGETFYIEVFEAVDTEELIAAVKSAPSG